MPARGSFSGVEYKPNAPVTFPVQWQDGKFPKVNVRSCSGACTVYGTSCLCNATATTERVFNGSLTDSGEVRFEPTRLPGDALNVGNVRTC